MSLLALIMGSSVVSFSVIALIDSWFFRLPWNAAWPEALFATFLGHWIGLLWLYRLRKS